MKQSTFIQNVSMTSVINGMHYFGFVQRAYFISSEESSGHTIVWRNCDTNEKVDGGAMTAYLLLHLLGKIKDFYSHQNFVSSYKSLHICCK